MKPIIEQICTDMRTEQEGELLRIVQSYGFNIDRTRLMAALIDARRFYNEGYEDGKNSSRWISVEENVKPRLRQDCLCICSYSDTKNRDWDYMMVLRWMGEGDNGYVNRPHFQHEGMSGMNVTHWMPLPEPPKEATP